MQTWMNRIPFRHRRAAAWSLGGMFALMLACGGGGSTKSSSPSSGAPGGTPGTLVLTPPPSVSGTYWVAFQDGQMGTWQAGLLSGGSYTFNVTDPGGRYGLAIVRQSTPGGPVQAHIYQFTRGDIATFDYSQSIPLTVGTCSGSLLGLGPTDTGTVAVRSSETYLPAGGSTYYIYAPTAATTDLLATRNPNDGPADRMAVMRGVTPTANTLPTLDLTSQGFQLTPATATLSGGAAGESTSMSASWSTSGATVPLAYSSGNLLTFNAVPLAQTLSTDMHAVAGQGSNGTSGVSRRGGYFGRSLGSTPLSLPTPTPVPTFGIGATAPYLRPSITWQALPGSRLCDFYGSSTLSSVTWNVHVSAGWLNGNGHPTYLFPDFTGVAGWDNSWALPAGGTLNWYFQSRYSSNPDPGYFTSGVRAYRDGTSFWVTWVSGSIVPQAGQPAEARKGTPATVQAPQFIDF
jgi:hypothetical protein